MAGQPKTRARKALAAMEAEAAKEADAPISDPPDPGSLTDDRASSDAPPRRKRGRPPGSGAGAANVTEPGDKRPASIRKIEDGLQQTFMIAGLGASMFDPFD